MQVNGTVASGSVKRVCASNVRMPRSQSITFGLPSFRMYSAASSSSSIVALGPRLSSTGSISVADRFQQAIVLHVARADLQHVGISATSSTSSVATTSVTTARPVSSRAVASIFSPSSFSPWKAIGAGARLEGSAAEGRARRPP